MTRALTTAVKNELATNEIRPIHLITIGFATPVNITDCSFPLTSSVSGSSVTYSSSSFIMGISNFTEETDVTKTTLNLTLSGADQTFISTCLNENVVNDEDKIILGPISQHAGIRVSDKSSKTYYDVLKHAAPPCLTPVSYTHLTLPTNREV